MNPKILGWPLFGGWLPFIGFTEQAYGKTIISLFLIEWFNWGIGLELNERLQAKGAVMKKTKGKGKGRKC